MLWRVSDIGGAYFDNKEMNLNDETETLTKLESYISIFSFDIADGRNFVKQI